MHEIVKETTSEECKRIYERLIDCHNTNTMTYQMTNGCYPIRKELKECLFNEYKARRRGQRKDKLRYKEIMQFTEAFQEVVGEEEELDIRKQAKEKADKLRREGKSL
ncbi:Cmc2 [Acrasis kona]|uniref:COX assembly mitochondrial protein n=1 Tax=Acrasis kona TaxID=1008807 RepID=A0AAW2Z5S1_9EUKA